MWPRACPEIKTNRWEGAGGRNKEKRPPTSSALRLFHFYNLCMPTEIRGVCETDTPKNAHSYTANNTIIHTGPGNGICMCVCPHSKTLVTKSGNADKELQCFFISLSCLMSFCRA